MRGVRRAPRGRLRPLAGAQPTDAYSALAVAGAYLLGSIPTGLWLGRRAGVDVRASGSGNIGATNVARTAGLSLGVLTLVIDAAKGALPVIVARRLDVSSVLMAAVGLAAIYGHIFSAFARFRGGKGVATAAGAFAAMAPLALLGSFIIFAVAILSSRIVSLASLGAATALPVLALILNTPDPIRIAAVITAATLFGTHRDNIRRLLKGTEPQFRSGAPLS